MVGNGWNNLNIIHQFLKDGFNVLVNNLQQKIRLLTRRSNFGHWAIPRLEGNTDTGSRDNASEHHYFGPNSFSNSPTILGDGFYEPLMVITWGLITVDSWVDHMKTLHESSCLLDDAMMLLGHRFGQLLLSQHCEVESVESVFVCPPLLGVPAKRWHLPSSCSRIRTRAWFCSRNSCPNTRR